MSLKEIVFSSPMPPVTPIFAFAGFLLLFLLRFAVLHFREFSRCHFLSSPMSPFDFRCYSPLYFLSPRFRLISRLRHFFAAAITPPPSRISFLADASLRLRRCCRQISPVFISTPLRYAYPLPL